jgi:hypothetical protein
MHNSTDFRHLPIYLDGFAAGRDVGLAFALTVITDEQRRRGDSPAAAYADGRLESVSRIIGARFRRV